MSVTLDTCHRDMSPLKAWACENMPCMSLTRDTSHLEMSPLNESLKAKIRFMLVTFETSQSPIGPCGASDQSPFGDRYRQISTALWNSTLAIGENTVGGLHGDVAGTIDPDDPTNISS